MKKHDRLTKCPKKYYVLHNVALGTNLTMVSNSINVLHLPTADFPPSAGLLSWCREHFWSQEIYFHWVGVIDFSSTDRQMVYRGEVRFSSKVGAKRFLTSLLQEAAASQSDWVSPMKNNNMTNIIYYTILENFENG